ncbi:hypothetical protein [Cellulomonas dongxiuzhuiae]|uniref:hypothetical protein n=1 Tax=Cellulomonas dongxiuzhuiae TaxID=2819979 RepID=UPI001AAFC748|nr:hypothetical protein [Cellulomonas dongxiuzhuiae]MBO3089473.1 hypothetical protein [Cellulomonas dongxiuzhuiae]
MGYQFPATEAARRALATLSVRSEDSARRPRRTLEWLTLGPVVEPPRAHTSWSAHLTLDACKCGATRTPGRTIFARLRRLTPVEFETIMSAQVTLAA